MKIQLLFPLMLTMGIVATQTNVKAQNIALTNLPSIGDEYRSAPYIKAAEYLQHLGRKRAMMELTALARTVQAECTITTNSSVEESARNRISMDMHANEERVAILCRMLFVPRRGFTFERPAYLGGPSFLGGTYVYPDEFSVIKNYTSWPSEPIEIVDGIPFLVVTGYGYEGIWDPKYAETYLGHCLVNCEWSDFHFMAKSPEGKQKALKKLLASKKWQRPLETWEQQFLEDQVQ